MDRVFSVGEISDQFWSPPPQPLPPSALPEDYSKMNRSSSEWAFQRFLQEASVVAVSASASASDSSPQSSSAPSGDKSSVIEIKDKDKDNDSFSGANEKTTASSSFSNGRSTSPFNVPAAPGAPQNVPVDSEEYQEFLKSKLKLACAAAAQSRASFLKLQDSSARADSVSQASNASQLGSHAAPKGAGSDVSMSQVMDANRLVGISSLPSAQKKPGDTVRPTTSGSSREQSEDDENEGETEITENMDPADAKRVRRMLSNRESARRSRRRKQAHLTELETQVSQLRVENSSLLKRLSDISQKYSEAAVDNRVLKADVETLRAKVKMAEETVKTITGLNPLFHAMPEISTINMPSFDGSASETSANAAVPVQDDPKHHFYQSPNNAVSTHDPRVNSALADISSVENMQPHSGAGVTGNKLGQTASLQRVASLEHLQKRIRRSASPSVPQPSGENQ